MSSNRPAGEPSRDAEPGTADERRRVTTWIVWRQDDNGNRFEVARFAVRTDADAIATTMEARRHKQTYWVAAGQ